MELIKLNIGSNLVHSMDGHHQDEKNQYVGHHPEFIVVEEEFKENVSGGAHQYQSSQYYEPLNKLSDIKPSFPLRFACFFCSIILFCASFLVVFLLMLSLGLVIISFGQVKKVNDICKRYWDVLKKLLVTASGLLVAVISPAFGLGIIILYFIIVAGGMNDPIFSKLFKSSLYQG